MISLAMVSKLLTWLKAQDYDSKLAPMGLTKNQLADVISMPTQGLWACQSNWRHDGSRETKERDTPIMKTQIIITKKMPSMVDLIVPIVLDIQK